MPHALLLSPDDQAVNAITGVLDEMSVTCERPLDGVSAAQKLNSQSFDLVLVDCENLPAAKLIFDVCRRGKNGNNPVPIAIVDGRAGLPTAFRLGAELILTKPVSKDQARTTIRTAVGRVRKDVPAVETDSADAKIPTLPDMIATSPLTNSEDHPMASAAAASAALTNFADPSPSFAPRTSKAAISATATPAKPPAAPDEHEMFLPKSNARPGALSVSSPDSSISHSTPTASASSKPRPPVVPSDDPVLAELERAESEESARSQTQSVATPDHAPAPSDAHAPVFSSYEQKQKPRSAFVALMALVVAAGGLYGAWMYQPGFRALAQPQIDRVLALAGKALPQTQAPQSATPVSQPAPAPTPVPPASAVNAGNTPATATDALTSAAANSAGASPATAAASVPIQPSVPQDPAAVSTPSSAANTAAPVADKPAADKLAADKSAVKPKVSKPAEIKKVAANAPLSDTPLPGENTAIILSSKGAEKRLAHSVPPAYPSGARAEGAEGTVILKEIVDENGKVEGVRLVEGNAALATAAMQAVKQWRYRPYVRDGKAQPFQTVVIVDFQKP